MEPGRYFSGNAHPTPGQGLPALIPSKGPVCYGLYFMGTYVGYWWDGGLSWDRGSECRKRQTAQGG